MRRDLPPNWAASPPKFAADPKGIATRAASGKAINSIAGVLPELFGGSADLAPSTNTLIGGAQDFERGQYTGRNLHFGVREHGMGSIVNGIAYHGGLRPYGATFLVFADYMRAAIRLSAIAQIRSIWVMTDDGVDLGEDGPRHQPVEYRASLRAIPNLWVIRPGGANETSAAWKAALARTDGPALLALIRQALPTLDFTSADGQRPPLERGAYILAEVGDGSPQIILMATGSELHLAVDRAARLTSDRINVRVVSFPCWELFEAQEASYRESILPRAVTARLAVEAGVPLGWERWVGGGGTVIGIDHFGASAPGEVLMREFGLTVDDIYETARSPLTK